MFFGILDFAKYWNGYELHCDNVEDILFCNDNMDIKHKLLVGYHSKPTLGKKYILYNDFYCHFIYLPLLVSLSLIYGP